MVDADLNGDPVDVAYGSAYPYQDDATTWADSLSLGGEDLGSFGMNNNLSRVAEGASVAFEAEVDAITFSGTAVVPDPLAGVTYNTSTRVVTWSTAATSHPAAWVTVRRSPTDGVNVQVAAFSAGTLTLPADWLTGYTRITVFATNQSSDLAPAASLDADQGYFRVSRADGTLNTDSFSLE